MKVKVCYFLPFSLFFLLDLSLYLFKLQDLSSSLNRGFVFFCLGEGDIYPVWQRPNVYDIYVRRQGRGVWVCVCVCGCVSGWVGRCETFLSTGFSSCSFLVHLFPLANQKFSSLQIWSKNLIISHDTFGLEKKCNRVLLFHIG